MQVDALAVRLRPRTSTEAIDLGVRLCQHHARAVYRCYLAVALPVIVVAAAAFEVGPWLAGTILWLAKPWLDRTILFVLSRAAFGIDTSIGDLWRSQWRVMWRPILFLLIVRRWSPWRSLTEPVYLLEDGPAFGSGGRIRQIRNRAAGSAFMMTQGFVAVELSIWASALSLLFWFAPAGLSPDISALFREDVPALLAAGNFAAYAVAVLVVEPFYVASGFAMYLNRRAELEAWDIEQELRRAFN